MIKKLSFFIIQTSILLCQWGIEHFLHPKTSLLSPDIEGSFIGFKNHSNIVLIDSKQSSNIYQSSNEIVSHTNFNQIDIDFKLTYYEERLSYGKELGIFDIYRQANPIQLNITYKNQLFSPTLMVQTDNGSTSYGLSSSVNIFPSLEFIYNYHRFKRDYDIKFIYDEFLMNQHAMQTEYKDCWALNYDSDKYRAHLSIVNNKYEIQKVSSENPNYNINSDLHNQYKYYLSMHYDIDKNHNLEFSLESKKLNLELDFTDSGVGFIKINNLHYLSNQASLLYHFRMNQHKYSYGITRKEIDIYGNFRIRTSFISSGFETLFAPIYDIKDSGFITSNIIHFNIEDSSTSSLKKNYYISYLRDFYNIQFKNTFRNFLGLEEDSSLENFKYSQKDAIVLAIQLVKKNNHIHYGVSFSQHIPISIKENNKNIDQDKIFNGTA